MQKALATVPVTDKATLQQGFGSPAHRQRRITNRISRSGRRYQPVNASFHILKDCRSYSRSPAFVFRPNRRSELRVRDAPIHRRTFGNAESNEVLRKQLPERACSGENRENRFGSTSSRKRRNQSAGTPLQGKQNRSGPTADRVRRDWRGRRLFPAPSHGPGADGGRF